MARNLKRKIIIKSLKQYTDFEYKSGDSLLTFPKELKHNKIKDIMKEKIGFVCIHSRGNGNTYDHYWGETELNALNNLYKYLIEEGWCDKN